MESKMGEYKLSKDAYPSIVIGIYGTIIDNGIHGKRTLSPQSIEIEVRGGKCVDIEELVGMYRSVDDLALEAYKEGAHVDKAEFCGYLQCLKKWIGEEKARQVEELVYQIEENMHGG